MVSNGSSHAMIPLTNFLIVFKFSNNGNVSKAHKQKKPNTKELMDLILIDALF